MKFRIQYYVEAGMMTTIAMNSSAVNAVVLLRVIFAEKFYT